MPNGSPVVRSPAIPVDLAGLNLKKTRAASSILQLGYRLAEINRRGMTCTTILATCRRSNA